MTSTIIAALLSVIAAIIWRQQLGTMHARLVDPIKTFGAGKPALTPEERKLVLSERVKETRWAFGLAWFAVAIGIILGTVLIGRVGAAFGRHGVNIHSAAVGAEEDADEAVMAITTDGPVPHEVIEEITAADDFHEGRAVNL